MSVRKPKPPLAETGEFVVISRFRGSGRIKPPRTKRILEHANLEEALAEAQQLAARSKLPATVFRQICIVPPPAEPKPVVVRKPRPGQIRTKRTPVADAPEGGRSVVVEVRRRIRKPAAIRMEK